MFKLSLEVQDLADTHFTISPLHEMASSMWPVYGGMGRAEHRPWVRRVRAHPGINHELLASMVSPRGWIADFVSPPPRAPRPRISGQLAQVRATPPGKVIADVLAAYGPSPLPPCLRDLERDPAGLRDRVADALGRYWSIVMAPRWPRVRMILESDLLHRGMQIAQRGPGAAFTGLDRRIRWQEGVLAVDIIRQWSRELPVAGRGLRLVPTLFVHFPHLPVDTFDPPVLAYPARGTAMLWGTERPEPAAPAPPEVARALLGRPRARLLALLGDPASTTELAGRLGVTPSAISQHLGVLAAAGLVTRTRAGRAVLYRRTGTGARLVNGSGDPHGREWPCGSPDDQPEMG